MFDFSNLNFNSLNFDLQSSDLIQEIYVKYLESGKPYFNFMNDESANIAQTVQVLVETILIQIIGQVVFKQYCALARNFL